MCRKTGPVELVLLFDRVALCDHNDPVTAGQFGQGCVDAGKKLDLVIGDSLGEALNSALFFGSYGRVGELFEAGDEGAPEAGETVTVAVNGRVLDSIQMLSYLFRSVNSMIEV